jgi:hypothetical protein
MFPNDPFNSHNHFLTYFLPTRREAGIGKLKFDAFTDCLLNSGKEEILRYFSFLQFKAPCHVFDYPTWPTAASARYDSPSNQQV